MRMIVTSVLALQTVGATCVAETAHPTILKATHMPLQETIDLICRSSRICDSGSSKIRVTGTTAN